MINEDKVLFYFYILKCPISENIKYVGRTVNPNKRLIDHIYEAKRNNRNKRERWIMSLLKKDLKPIFQVIYKEYCNLDSAIEIEKMLVKKIGKRFDLKNSPDNYLGAVLTGKIVYQYNSETGEFIKSYRNSNQAYIEIGIKDCNIGRCCKDEFTEKITTAGNYFWSFNKYDFYPKKKNKDWRRLKGKPVVMFSMDGKEIERFKTARMATEKTGIPYKQISRACKQILRSAYGYRWKFL